MHTKKAFKSKKKLYNFLLANFRVKHQPMSDNNTRSKHSDMKLVSGLSIYTKRGHITEQKEEQIGNKLDFSRIFNMFIVILSKNGLPLSPIRLNNHGGS